MNKKIALGLVCIFGFISIIDLLHPGFPVTHDGQDQIARIANFYKNLSEGTIIPRWAGNLNWGYGHPILEFLYPFPSYLASLFHFAGFSFIDSTKSVFGLAMIFSGIFMFLWLSAFLEIIPATTGAIMYMFVPYRFVDMYVRGDIGEHVAFAFMPLILFFIYQYFQTKKIIFGVGVSIAVALLILSHNAISLMYLPFVLFYCMYLAFTVFPSSISADAEKIANTKYFILNTLFFLFLGFGLSTFFWVPAFFEGKYTLRNIVTAGEYIKRFVSFPELLYGSWNYGQTGKFTVQLGVVQWFMFLFSMLSLGILHQRRDKKLLLVVVLIFYTVIAILLMLPISQMLWAKIMLLQNFQFPWRFLAIPVFSTAVLGAIVVSQFEKKQKKIFFGMFLLAILIANMNFFHANGYFSKSDYFFNSIYNGTTDTGESAPMWSVRFMEHGFSKALEVLEGQATIQQLKRTSIKHSYEVIASQRSRLLENTLFFLYWEVFVDNKKTNIEFQDIQHRGLITFYVEKGSYTVDVRYSNTRLRKISDIVSLGCCMLLISLLLIAYRKGKNLMNS